MRYDIGTCHAAPRNLGVRRSMWPTKTAHHTPNRNLAVSVKEKVADERDYFDVKATLPQSPTELDAVFGTQEEIGCKMT